MYYASVSGLGGITPIQVKQIYSKDLMGINITGSVEKVMEESVKVAKTVAWNLLTDSNKTKIIKDGSEVSIYIFLMVQHLKMDLVLELL